MSDGRYHILSIRLGSPYAKAGLFLEVSQIKVDTRVPVKVLSLLFWSVSYDVAVPKVGNILLLCCLLTAISR